MESRLVFRSMLQACLWESEKVSGSGSWSISAEYSCGRTEYTGCVIRKLENGKTLRQEVFHAELSQLIQPWLLSAIAGTGSYTAKPLFISQERDSLGITRRLHISGTFGGNVNKNL